MHSRYFYIFLLIISLLVAFYFARSSFYLYSAKSTLITAENTLNKLKFENQSLKKDIEYRKTDQYVVNEAREKLNYGFEGESIIIVPKDLSKQLEIPEKDSAIEIVPVKNAKITTSTAVVKMWLDVFF